MSLYSILLADDEEEVRKGIIRRIDWENLGFQVVGDAENGEEALEKIEQLKSIGAEDILVLNLENIIR